MNPKRGYRSSTTETSLDCTDSRRSPGTQTVLLRGLEADGPAEGLKVPKGACRLPDNRTRNTAIAGIAVSPTASKSTNRLIRPL